MNDNGVVIIEDINDVDGLAIAFLMNWKGDPIAQCNRFCELRVAFLRLFAECYGLDSDETALYDLILKA